MSHYDDTGCRCNEGETEVGYGLFAQSVLKLAEAIFVLRPRSAEPYTWSQALNDATDIQLAAEMTTLD